ncbi:MAG: sulfatase-like hydrolase/transferase [Anaerolineaceae bacterium]|nr:sulfatase-like hydrolase/transferase [Anaerolineaceae bacterium]
MSTRPHILIFNPDQWRTDVLGHMGNPAAVTPHLDEFVEREAVSFRWAFCQNPVCTPSRCSFMTGWYPHVHGHRTMYHMLRSHEPLLLQTLREAGYFVWWGGKNDLVPGQGGFERVADLKFEPEGPIDPDPHQLMMNSKSPDDDGYYSMFWGKLEKRPGAERYRHWDWAMIEGAIDFLHNAPDDQPLVIYLPLQYPHPPYAVEEPYFSMIDRSKLPPRAPTPAGWKGKPSLLKGICERQNLGGWTEQQWTELRAVYYGMCARVDDQFHLVLDALRETGLYDDTAIFLFSDHGDFTGDYGLVEKTQNTFEDCLTRVPLVVKPPRGVPVRPRVTEAMAELIDVPATIEALTGIEPRHTHFGRSLLPVVAGDADEHRDAVFCEGGRLHGEDHCSDRQSTSSLNPAGLYWPRVGLQQSQGPEHTKATMCRTRNFKYVRRLYEQDELYDLRSDPQELVNRIADPSLADDLARLKERMLTWYQETCDTVPHDSDRR